MSRRLPTLPRRAFVDTSAYYGLTDAGEATHPVAVIIRDRLIAGRFRLFTTNFVLAEIHALTLVRLGRVVAKRVLDQLDRSNATIVRVSASDELRARAIISRYDDKNFSLTDAISFVVMERLKITHAFTFDRHFGQYGFSSPVSAQGGPPNGVWLQEEVNRER